MSSSFVGYLRHLFDKRTYLYFLEKLFLLYQYSSDKPQIFILGLPRSGTTLIYQYIVHRLNVAYFTNGVGANRFSPCIITFFQIKRHGKYKSSFKSHYGKVQGAVSPREAGGFWGRFFDINNYINFNEINTQQIKTLKNTVACVQKMFGNLPFVNKNVKHMLRIDAINKIFPNAYFLIVERNLKEVGLSVLRGRHKLLKNPTEWWSVRPPDYEELKDLPVAEQVAFQLLSLEKKMHEDLSRIPQKKVLKINYGDFCKEPERLIQILKPVLKINNFRNPSLVSFDQSKKQPQTPEEIHLIKLIQNATTI